MKAKLNLIILGFITLFTPYTRASLFNNGDFENGDISFTSDYNYYPCWSGAPTLPRTYSLATDPYLCYPASGVASYGDHTTGSGNMMMVNGSDLPNKTVWSANPGVQSNTDYVFSYYLSSWSEPNPAKLRLYINDTPIGADANAPTTTGYWQLFSYNWNSGDATQATIKLVDMDLNGGGNDFALDDMSLIVLESSSPPKVTNPNPSNGETDRPIPVYLSWSPSNGATSYDIYFGTNPIPDNDEFKRNQSGTWYDPSDLSNNTTYYWRIDSKNSIGTTTGDVWSFTTDSRPATPPSGIPNSERIFQKYYSLQIRGVTYTSEGQICEVYVYDDTDDSLAYGEIKITNIANNNVIFSKHYGDYGAFDPTEQGSIPPAGHTWDSIALPYDVPLEIKIWGQESSSFNVIFSNDIVALGGTFDSVYPSWIGNVIISSQEPTPPTKVTNPSPTNGTKDTPDDLDWSTADRATSYDVYFGVDPNPEFKINQTGNSYDIPETLSNDRKYYWRIDSKNSGGTTTGDIWSFTTGSSQQQIDSPAIYVSVEDITATTANLVITLDDGGGACDISVSCASQNKTFEDVRSSEYTFSLENLTPNTKYYYTAEVINSGGSNSIYDSFTTLSYITSIELKRFEINQCFQDVTNITDQAFHLIETKPFVVRIDLQRTEPGTTQTTIELEITSKDPDNEVILEGWDKVSITYPNTKRVTFRFLDYNTKDITAGWYYFHLKVKNEDDAVLLDRTLEYEFKSSKNIRILPQPLDYGNDTGTWDDKFINFSDKVFPIPRHDMTNVNHIEILNPEPPLRVNENHTRSQIVVALELLLSLYNDAHPTAPANIICGIAPYDYIDGSVGYQSGRVVVIEIHELESIGYTHYILGHELGHVKELGDFGEEYIMSKESFSNDPEYWTLTPYFNFESNPPPLSWNEEGKYRLDIRPNPPHYENLYFNEVDQEIQPHSDFKLEPASWDRWYVWCDGNHVVGGGYDVDENHMVSSSDEVTYLSMMSAACYACAGIDYWISAPEYATLIESCVQDNIVRESSIIDYTLPLSNPATKMIISGTIDVLAAQGIINCPVPVTNIECTLPSPDSALALLFKSDTNDVLSRIPFDPIFGEIWDPNHIQFHLIVDVPENAVMLEVQQNDVVVATVSMTANSPIVNILSPIGGEYVDDILTIQWLGSDLDGDNLRYTVKFSNKNGIEWNTLALEQYENELIVDANDLPGGSQCLIKVVASDGWNSSEDISDATFTVATKPPNISLFDPANGEIFIQSDFIQGRCTARDPETGEITDPNVIVWTSDINGFLGNGGLIGFYLSPGLHIISVTATDPEGKSTTEEISITVLDQRSDFNIDFKLDYLDLQVLADNWLLDCNGPDRCMGTDLDRSRYVDFADFAIFSKDWVSDDHLVAYWQFDEGSGWIARDSAGFYNGNIHEATWTTGLINGALNFDGNGDYVDCGVEDELSPEIFTISLWIYPEVMAHHQEILGKAIGLGSSTDYSLYTYMSSKLEFLFGENLDQRVKLISESDLPLDQWVHIAVTRDGSVASLYMNGQLEKSEFYSFTPTQKGHNLIIGGIGTRGDWAGFFKGKIDDVRIYDIALSGEEISTLYEENLQ